MAKTYYKYNPETDNFERIFITPAMRVIKIFKFLLVAGVFGFIIYFVSFHRLVGNSEKELREDNAQLRSQYNVLRKRLDNALLVMENLQNRDDNFYRVIMQMDPMSRSKRFAGLNNESFYRKAPDLSDESLLKSVTGQLDLLERQIYVQSISYNQLRDSLEAQKHKLTHIPSVLPLKDNDFTLSSGYGYRRDPIDASRRFHKGIDFAAPTGSRVIATADGIVAFADRKGSSGIMIELSHGFNYTTEYANLNQVFVKKGQKVKRGEVIGQVGSTGKSLAPHLHYEVKLNDRPQNPINYFFMEITPDQYGDLNQIAENAANILD